MIHRKRRSNILIDFFTITAILTVIALLPACTIISCPPCLYMRLGPSEIKDGYFYKDPNSIHIQVGEYKSDIELIDILRAL